MRKINAIVDLNLTPLPDSERGAGEIAEAIDRNAGGFVEPGYEIGRSEMREVMNQPREVIERVKKLSE